MLMNQSRVESLKEQQILFRGAMVRAILDGSKTQTRRAFDERTIKGFKAAAQIGEVSHFIDEGFIGENDTSYILEFCPYGQVGDHLWVRETMSVTSFFQSEYKSTEYGSDEHLASCWVKYSADGELAYIDELSRNNDFGVDEEAQALRASKKKSVPPIHMPRWASRITLEIVNIRVERLKDISEEDAKAEGMKFTDYGRNCFHNGSISDVGDCPGADYTHPQRDGWSWKETTHQDQCVGSARFAFANLWESINGDYSWDLNPWVWVIEFKRVI